MKTFMKRLMSLTLTISLFLGYGSLMAQNNGNYISISGTIKDSKTKQKVVFASVSVPGTNIGTVSNSDGEFTLKVQNSLSATEFEVSHLGYQNKKFKIAESKGMDQVFLIDPYSVELKELVVKPEDPRSIILGAIRKIDENYSSVPNLLTGFYRETIKQRRDYVSIAEAVIDIYKAPYSSYSSDYDRVKVFKGRKGGNVKKVDTLVVKLVGGPNISLLLDIAKNPDVLLSKDNVDFYTYELLDVVNIDGKLNYEIGFTPVVSLDYPLYYGKIYVAKDNLAITMAQFSLDLKDEMKAAQYFVKKKPLGLRFVPTSTSYLVTYKEQDGKYYLNYVRNEVKFSCNWKRRIFKTNYTVMSEMAVTERKTENIEKITSKESFKQYVVLADKVHEYFDENYWGEYNTIVPDESIQSAINKFNKRFKKQ